MGVLRKLRFTPEEYLALELPAEYKSQYVAGEIFAMAGAQPWHDNVTSNILFALGSRIRRRGCSVFTSDMRVRVKDSDMYTYPDVSALCGEPAFETANNPQTLLNPQVIFEVLSPSTEAFDRGEKFARYRKLPSLIDYVIVSPERVYVEHHNRQANGTWRLREYGSLSNAILLAGVDCELPLSEIYERVNFPS